MKTRLYRFQRQDLNRYDHFDGRVLDASEMGLGKTVKALWWAKHRLEKGTIVVVCPADLKWHWQREALHHVGIRAEVLEGLKVRRHTPRLMPGAGMYVVNYEILGAWLKYLRRLRPKLVILDEVQYISNRHAKRTNNCRELVVGVPHLLGLGGTGGVENLPVELFPIVNMVRPDKFPSFWEFAHRYCGPRWRRWGWEFKGATNLDRLRRKLLKVCMVRRRAEDVIDDLPTKIVSVIPVDIDDRRQYLEAENDFIRWLRRTHPKKASRTRKAERMVRMGYLKRLAGLLKLKAVKKWIQSFLHEEKGKLIVFAVHRKVLREGLYVDKDLKPISIVIDGSVSNKSRKGRPSPRQEAYDHFNVENTTRVLLANIRAAGKGWSCKTSSDVLFPELDWVPGKHAQAANRIRGLGRGLKGRPARITFMVGKGTIEEDILKVLQVKQRNIDAILDGKTVSSEAELYDQLEERLLKRGVRKK